MKLKKGKKIQRKNNSTPKKKIESCDTLFSKEEQEFHLSKQYATKAIIEKFADAQLEFFNNNPNAYYLETYRLIKGVPQKTYYNWLKQNKHLAYIHAFCLEIIAFRRKKKMAENDPKFLKETLYKYNPRYDEANKYWASLKKFENESKKQNIKVVFEDYKEKK